MVLCPDCGKNVDADFGMTTCPHCEAVFMVDYDGAVKPAESFENLDLPEDIESEPMVGSETESSEEIETFSPAPETDQGFDSQNEGGSFSAETETEGEDIATEDMNTDSTEYTEEFLDTLSTPPASSLNDTNDPLEVQRFDESAASTLQEGLYTYDVMISGLDTLQLKQEVLMALADVRFGFNSEDIKKSIKGGILNLRGLNPVKAVLIVLRLQDFDVDVSWTQKTATNTSSEESTT